MAVACPNCAHRIPPELADLGQPQPRCPGCSQPLLVSGGIPEISLQPEDARTRFARAPVPAAGGNSSVRRSPVGDEPPVEVASGEPTPPGEPEEPPLPPGTEVCGYAIDRVLGRGGMGTVYLATQLSLDRPVALKVMGRKWAGDPVFVARFTREAFAAAQLSHPNIVQIHDIGELSGARFFSMEYVRGRSLSDLVRADGKLDPETAVGYVLQAARGLKHAHDRGMIHRDVKPDNLLIDAQGVVKVADLGLVKLEGGGGKGEGGAEGGIENRPARAPSASSVPPSPLRLPPFNLTGDRIALGTPAYMSPEQCRDAASVDHRADIYSLGCTLYVLVTGQPPFQGTTAVALMSKHAYEPLVPPEEIASRVPKEISGVIQRMMAKVPDDRYADMGEVIRTLEAWLGVHHTGTFAPQEEQISRLEAAVAGFHACPAAVLRDRLVSGFFGMIALSAVLLAFAGNLSWAFGMFGLALEAALAYFLLDGMTRGGHLFTCTKRFLAGLGTADWAVGVSAFTLFCILLAVTQVLWLWLGFGLAGVILAVVLRYTVDRAVADERRAVLDMAERQLRRMRARGLDEESLRAFVAKFAGRRWEEFFEALFGYEAKLAARAVLSRGGAAGARDKYAAWREPVVAALERFENARREARARKLLLAVERANLLAAGQSAEDAESHAMAAADAMVRAAADLRHAETGAAPGHRTAVMPAGARALVRAAERPADFVPAPERSNLFAAAVGLAVGPYVRAVAAAVLFSACVLWANQNALLPGAGSAAPGRRAEPLALAALPRAVTAWADGWNVGLAGVLLVVSLGFRGNRTGALALLGASVAAAGHQLGVRTVEPFHAAHIALLLGAVLVLLGCRLGAK